MIAICVGHSRMGDDGAVSVGGVSEWGYNSGLARVMAAALREKEVECVIIEDYPRKSYGAAMGWLGKELRRLKVRAAVELHFNSSDRPSATGHEWLHWYASGEGRRLARCLSGAVGKEFPGVKSRGLVALDSGRGEGFLRETPCPAVICEPFFGSNEMDEWIFTAHRNELGEAMAAGILKWVGGGK